MSSAISAVRYHDFSAGHRVYGHESKCAFLHGHNYRVTFHVRGALDQVGRVWDFSQIKATLCEFLEREWDHKFLAWDGDEIVRGVAQFARKFPVLEQSIVWVKFNPTAENMAAYLGEVVGPMLLPPGLELFKVEVSETRKCSAIWEL